MVKIRASAVLVGVFLAVTHSVSAMAEDACRDFRPAMSCGNFKCEPEKGETPENCPIDCNVTDVRSYNAEVFCTKVDKLFAPDTIEEAQRLIVQAAFEGKSVRPAGSRHSGTSLICSDDVILSTDKLNRILGIRELNGEKVVDVEPGAKLGAIADWLHGQGYTLGLVVPNYPHITAAGGLSTASHGTSRVFAATLAGGVREIELVTASGERRLFNPVLSSPRDWNAVRVALGALGFISRLSYRIEPQFSVNVKTKLFSDRKVLRQYPEDWKLQCDAETYFWFPNQGKALRFCGRRTTKPAEPGARNTILIQGSTDSSIQELLRQVLHYSRCDDGLASIAESLVLFGLNVSPPFMKKGIFGLSVSSHDVTGYSHRMVVSDFPDPNRKFYSIIDWSLAIPPQNVTSALTYVKGFFKARKVTLPVGGITLRFVHQDGATLAPYNFGGGPEVPPTLMFEFVTYDPQRVQGAAREKMDRDINEMVRTLVNVFHARPHWGKNRDWVLEEAVRAGSYSGALREFLEVKRELDPKDVFGNRLTRSILAP